MRRKQHLPELMIGRRREELSWPEKMSFPEHFPGSCNNCIKQQQNPSLQQSKPVGSSDSKRRADDEDDDDVG